MLLHRKLLVPSLLLALTFSQPGAHATPKEKKAEPKTSTAKAGSSKAGKKTSIASKGEAPAKAAKKGTSGKAKSTAAASKAQASTPGKAALAAGKTQKSGMLSAAGIEKEVMALPKPQRAQALSLMMMSSILTGDSMVDDSSVTGRQAVNYSSGFALAKLQPLFTAAGLPAAAECIGKFSDVLKNPAKRLHEVFPKGCSGLNELHAGAATDTNTKLESMANRWATSALQQGFAEAKAAGFTFRTR
jgi:hypothetical protein